MKVKAKCISRAWDGMACVLYHPGEVYEIENDSQLASLKVGNDYVFQFDRTGTRTDDGIDVVKDYSCKKCGVKFKTLNALGVHSNQNHRDVHEAATLADDEPIVERVDGRKKPRTFTCKTCGEVLPNLYRMRVHNQGHQQVETAETVPVPA